jgi:AcrR family transcriptional regulator
MARATPRRVGRPRASDAEPTPNRILSAALRLFADQGFAATSVRQIATAVGVTDAALYSHFPGKQAIFDHLVESMGPPTAALLGFDFAAAAQAGPRVAIPAAVERLLAHWSQPEVRMFTAVLLREGSRAAAPVQLAGVIETARAALTPVFAGWQEASQLRTDVPARQIVWELLAPLNVIRFLYLGHDASAEEIADARQLADDHLDYFLACTITETPEGSTT